MSERQFALDLGHSPAFGRDDFLVAPCNAEAVAWLERWPAWPAHGLILYGPPGSGKSHLLAAFAAAHADAGAVVVAAADLDDASIPGLVDGQRIVLVDDIDRLRAESALFHLHNLTRETGRFLVLAASRPPSHLPVRLPDLASRLNALPAVGIGAPDDAVLAAVMVKQFADRQLKVGEEVIAFLVGRMERSFAAARLLVEAIDRTSLTEKRAITVPLARMVLDGIDDRQGELPWRTANGR
ncbi:MAG: DnaA/Hda family protein [Magnetospirillum sp.]|nr:DnaA/Hda family protein [Magnetospirillum sp.]